MDTSGKMERILIADDEETFLYSTAELLRKEGFVVDCAYNTKIAVKLLAEHKYDLLISDIKMPDNQNLSFIKNTKELAESMSVILVTGYPSLDTAMQSIHLPISAYLVKPIDFSELLKHVREAIDKKSLFNSIDNATKRLQEIKDSFESINASMYGNSPVSSSLTVSAFLSLTLQNISGSIADLQYLFESLSNEKKEKQACNLFQCPANMELKSAITETINVLEKTKSSFKSKELGNLRKRLESLELNN
jgi:DNA-binding response OmpR family regulator